MHTGKLYSQSKAKFPHLPNDFIVGTATSAYQIEGAWQDEGKGESIWDRFVHTAGKIKSAETADIACNHYHLVDDDVALLKYLGFDAYRFSISWPRILPNGTGQINQRGLDFYKRLLEQLHQHNITPFVTLYHWDLPQALQEQTGWANPECVNWFLEYVEVVQRELGELIPNWITFNEIFVNCVAGQFLGIHAPGRYNIWAHYQAMHNQMRSHGLSARLLKAAHPTSQVGVTLDLRPIYPLSSAQTDKDAVHFADLTMRRMLLDPILKGYYPQEHLDRAWMFMPNYSPQELADIHAPIDFIGVNNYSRDIVSYSPWFLGHNFMPSYTVHAPEQEYEENGKQYTAMGWEIYPDSLYEILMLLKDEYNNPKVYITENGAAFNDVLSRGRVHDTKRVDFYQRYMQSLSKAIDQGSNCAGYFAWSFLDNFEWHEGYKKRFGIVHVDYANQKRTIKDSGYWFRDLQASRR
ncbi:GH1 family beta-glucosidase [Saccharobesus litoralis]|uniref:GH1 family beta-glucosidase n=1 Tax=Saccharobesus litoralis TaxID=2172099 RepID=UPI00131F171F|nr:GH1 family beta-glucosidase [Saccharobesus litoralis]